MTCPRSREILLAAALFSVVLLARLATRAVDPWEWDEVLFTEAVDKGLDVRQNHPHAPGYPLFVEAGRLVASVGIPPFRAVTLSATVAAALAPPAAAFLASACGLSPPFAILAGMLYAFIPSVWLHGVRPLTEGTATLFLLVAAGLAVRFLRGGGPRLALAFFPAAAAAVAVRPQVVLALFPIAVVVLLAALRRGPTVARGAGLGLVLAAALSLVAWIPLVQGSGGVRATFERIRWQRELTGEGDRATARELATAAFWLRWGRDPYGSSPLAAVVYSLAVAGVVARPRIAGRLALALLPVVVPTIALQAEFAAPRYSAVFLPLPAALAALGLEALGSLHPAGRAVAALVGAYLVGAEASVGAPLVLETASSASPPNVVLAHIASDRALDGRKLVADNRLLAHASVIVRGRRVLLLPEGRTASPAPGEVLLTCDRKLQTATPFVRASFGEPLLPRVTIGRFLSVAAYDGGPAGAPSAAARTGEPARIDLLIPASVDYPARGAEIRGPLLARGWARERGGGRVDPVEFLLDGRPIVPEMVRRTRRADVVATIPETGNAEGIGWEALFRAAPPGGQEERSLVVVFRTPDGRIRPVDPVRFRWE